MTHSTILRHDGRLSSEIRLIKITPGVFEYAPGSVLFELGKTKILCAISIQQQVPHFLKGKKEGWLTCEYAMLPMSTSIRSQREVTLNQRNGRSVEISRFLGRVIRSIIDVSIFPDKTIIVDCDVLQADGSTRVASTMAASLALEIAQQCWLDQKVINKPFLTERLYAISVGVVKGNIYTDLDFVEDNEAQADFNFVMTESGKLVEILGGAEKNPLSLQQFNEVQCMAYQGIESIKKMPSFQKIEKSNLEQEAGQLKPQKVPIFSLQNRLFSREM